MAIAQWEQNQTPASIVGDINMARGTVAPDPWRAPHPPAPGVTPPLAGPGAQPEALQLTNEYNVAIREAERSPDANANDIIDRMDADAVLERRILMQRHSVWGRLQRLWENGPARLIGGTVLSGMAGFGIRAGLKAIGAGNVVAGGVAGGVIGFFVNWIRARNCEESAATWMRELNIQGDTQETYDRIEQMNPGQLELTLGILRQAIMHNRVRGSEQDRMSLALKYRQIRNRLQYLNAESAEMHENGHPIFENIQQQLQATPNEYWRISRAAGEKYNADYERIYSSKRRRELMRGVKGAAVGLLSGITFGLIGNYMAGGQEAAAAHSAGADAVSSHAAAVNPVDHYSAAQHQVEGMQNFQSSNQFNHDALAAYHNVIDNNAAVPTDPALAHAVQELTKLNQGGIAVDGFPKPEFGGFMQMIQGNANAHDIWSALSQHNIDPSSAIHGQPFANYLLGHKDLFMQMPPEVQHFVISHPDFSQPIFDSVAKTAEVAGGGFHFTMPNIAPILDKVFAAVGIVGATGGFIWAHREHNRINRDLSAVHAGGYLANKIDEVNQPVGVFNQGRAERLRGESLAQFTLNRVVLPPRLFPPVLATQRGRGNINYGSTFDISSITTAGDIVFGDNGFDRAERFHSRAPLRPEVNGQPINVYRDLIAPDGHPRDDVILLYNSGTDADTQRGKEKTAIDNLVQTLPHSELEFGAGFLGHADRNYAALPTRANRRFVVNSVDGNTRKIRFDLNLGETENQMPTIFLDEILTPDGHLSGDAQVISQGADRERQRTERNARIEQLRNDIRGARLEFTPAFMTTLAVATPGMAMHTDRLYLVDGFGTNNQIILKPRRGEQSQSMPVVRIEDLVDANGNPRTPELFRVEAAANAGPDNLTTYERNIALVESTLSNKDLIITDATTLLGPAHINGGTPHLDHKYRVLRVNNGMLVFDPRPGDDAAHMPLISVADIVTPMGQLDEPSRVILKEPTGRQEAGQNGEGIERYNLLRGRNFDNGQFRRQSGHNYFMIDDTPAGLAHSGLTIAQLDAVLGAGNRELFINDDNSINNLPRNLRTNIRIQRITDIGGGVPKYEVEMNYVAPFSGEVYTPAEFYAVGPSAAKTRLINILVSTGGAVATLPNYGFMIQPRDGFYTFDHYQAAVAGGAPERFFFRWQHDNGGSAMIEDIQELERNDLTNSSINRFDRV
ncbi:MAG: hypothetical protein NTW50_03065 [Candidatus Berkelbacteria bacterium]|nr:hypothetical protein [Candidatus Berkelbacteria bacterium]